MYICAARLVPQPMQDCVPETPLGKGGGRVGRHSENGVAGGVVLKNVLGGIIEDGGQDAVAVEDPDPEIACVSKANSARVHPRCNIISLPRQSAGNIDLTT
jgi:hypothetical protein